MAETSSNSRSLAHGASIISLIRNDPSSELQLLYQDRRIWDQRSWSVLAEPGDPNSHYSVYEDKHGTHILSHDLNMMTKCLRVGKNTALSLGTDVYCPGENFVKITEYFGQGPWFKMEHLHRIASFVWYEPQLHPANRLDTGFCDYEPDRVKQ